MSCKPNKASLVLFLIGIASLAGGFALLLLVDDETTTNYIGPISIIAGALFLFCSLVSCLIQGIGEGHCQQMTPEQLQSGAHLQQQRQEQYMQQMEQQRQRQMQQINRHL